MKSIFSKLLFATLILILTGCSRPGADDFISIPTPSPTPTKTEEKTPVTRPNPVVTIEMENGEKIVVELFPDVAFNTVCNFISLVKKGFFNGLTFHRVIPNFIIQGGDPDGVGTGGPGYTIRGEFASNGITNNLNHVRGVISMARTADNYNSAGSQFFIVVKDAMNLDNGYAAFGFVRDGMDVVDKISLCEKDSSYKPVYPQVMKKVTVETFGYVYPEPEIIQQSPNIKQ
ncbi:MAG: putative bifunctional phosphatase/peptidyl-prolyl cis-trans isomerase [Firmicutes bacterium ADurb.Bin193]|nr:MAG: putative bifunctional phosphatase/peptidyl-prolyl cis-trans isomerase [Firmicutes bacterium ADurb.Bin193]